MFNQSEKKLKTWATIQGMFFSVVAIVLGAVIYSAAAATDNNAVGLLLGVIVAVVVWFLSMLSVWTLYSFADLVEYTKANNEILASMDSTLGQIADCLSTGENNESTISITSSTLPLRATLTAPSRTPKFSSRAT